MSEQPDLFYVPRVLSPRLRWMKRHKVLLFLSLPDDPVLRCWFAAFDCGDWPGYEGAADYFAHEIAAHGDSRIGEGRTDDEAILDLCEKRQVRHWTLEAVRFPNSDRGPRFLLWEHLHNEHKLTLLDSELEEIIAKANACRPLPIAPPDLARRPEATAKNAGPA
jgi:hypothetical protein